MKKNKKIIISANTAWNIVNFRSTLIKKLVAEDLDVIILAPYDESVDRLIDLGCIVKNLPMESRGTNLIKEILLFVSYIKVFMTENPSAYLGFTIKPNLYGSIAARICKIPTINNITGLGTIYIKKSWKTVLANFLYKIALRESVKVFFQNQDDLNYFLARKIVPPDVADKVPGSGVDLVKFSYKPIYKKNKIRFILISRLLAEKGIEEYITAARIISEYQPNTEFFLLGSTNKDAGTKTLDAQSCRWISDQTVRYLGRTDDVREHLYAADCVVLPSYREGVPRILLEAAAVGRPTITTSAPGCKEVVDDGITGFICSVADPIDLAQKMKNFLFLTDIQRVNMGSLAREKMEREFDEQFVLKKYMSEMKQFL